MLPFALVMFNLVSPLSAPAHWQAVELEVMNRVNYARSHGFNCQTRSYQNPKPVASLVPHPKLLIAARGHAEDMQARGYFDHTDPDGQKAPDRIAATGFMAARTGENILGGQRLGASARTTVKWWLESAPHCKNIMNPAFTHFAAGHVFVQNDPAGLQHYWVLNFATPRKTE